MEFPRRSRCLLTMPQTSADRRLMEMEKRLEKVRGRMNAMVKLMTRFAVIAVNHSTTMPKPVRPFLLRLAT